MAISPLIILPTYFFAMLITQRLMDWREEQQLRHTRRVKLVYCFIVVAINGLIIVAVCNLGFHLNLIIGCSIEGD